MNTYPFSVPFQGNQMGTFPPPMAFQGGYSENNNEKKRKRTHDYPQVCKVFLV